MKRIKTVLAADIDPFAFPGLLGRGLIEACQRFEHGRYTFRLPRSTGPGPH